MINISDLPKQDILPGFEGKFVHTSSMTIGRFVIEKGAILPAHSHVHEQVSQVLEGQFELTIDGQTHIYEVGMVAVIPSNIVHSGKAITDCVIMDVFVPVREEYKVIGL